MLAVSPEWTRRSVSEKFEVVEDGLHPGGEFFILGAGEEADVLAQGHDGPCDEEPLDSADLLLEAFVHPGGEGEQRFAGAGGAHERDHLHVIIEEQIEGHDLLHVPRLTP